jgi:hypothetical protein
MNNPFYITIDGGCMSDYEPKNIYQIDYVYVLYQVKNDDINKLIYEKKISEDSFNILMKNFGLIKISGKILFQKYFKSIATKISNDTLRKYFPIEDNKGDDDIVIPLINMNYDNIKVLKKLFIREFDIYDYDKIFNVRDNLDLCRSGIVNDRIDDMIQYDNYWKNERNCNFNMDDIFSKRNFIMENPYSKKLFINLKGVKNFNTNLSSYTPDDTYKFDKIYTTNKYYPVYDSIKTENKFVDIFRNLKKIYKKTKDIIFLKQRYKLFNSLITSKEYCHLALNNMEILEINSDLFNKYMPIYSYIIGYAWITLYLEECIINTRSKKTDRHVFDIDTASKLPVLPFTFENIHSNPYVSFIVSKKLYETNKCFSIDSLEDYKKYYGICNKEEFFKRFNVFSSGKSDVNIFDGIDNRFSISGSMISACALKYNPLIDKVSDDSMSYDAKFNSYFDHYYKESDIDVMVNSESTFNFIRNASEFINLITKNLDVSRKDMTLDVDKKTAINITKHFFTNCVDDYNDQLDEDYTPEELEELVRENMDEDFRNYFYRDYVNDKTDLNKKWKKEELIKNLKFDSELIKAYRSLSSIDNITFNLVSYDLTNNDIKKKDSEIYYFVNDFRDDENKVPASENYLVFKYAESIKFKIKSDKLKREIEVFSNPRKDPFNKVARFHLPCVRAYIQNNNVYMLPSFITSMMTMLNIDYKYFAGSRDPISIINKYRTRGFSNILNSSEMEFYEKYNDDIDIERFKGSGKRDKLTINNDIFHVKDIDKDIYRKLELKYMNSDKLKTLYDKYSETNTIDFSKISYVKKNGYINPLKTWIMNSIF